MDDFYPIRLLRTHAYALVDREALGGNVPADWPLIPLVPRGLENDARRLPALLPVEAMTEDQRMALLETLDNPPAGYPLPVVTLFDSHIDPEQMRVHWVNRLLVRVPGGQQFLLRSYDPRVFAQLQWMFSLAQLAALFGPIQRWTICLEGHWHGIRPPEHDDLSGGAIGAEQAALLARIGPINEVLFKLPQEQRHAHEQASRAIDALLSAGVIHRLESRNAFFACHATHTADRDQIVLACERCGRVAEVPGKPVFDAISSIAKKAAFKPVHTVAEVSGVCDDCQAR